MSIPKLDVFQVIADPSRREILSLLTKDTQNINSLATNFNMSRPAVSKHIKILEHAGFISVQVIGRERHCNLNQDGFIQLKNWINFFDNFWNNKFTNLENALNAKSKNK